MLPHIGLSTAECFVESGIQHIPLAGFAVLEPGDLGGVAFAPLLQVPVAEYDDAASTMMRDVPNAATLTTHTVTDATPGDNYSDEKSTPPPSGLLA